LNRARRWSVTLACPFERLIEHRYENERKLLL
jgi:hypothetical protein